MNQQDMFENYLILTYKGHYRERKKKPMELNGKSYMKQVFKKLVYKLVYGLTTQGFFNKLKKIKLAYG